MSLETETLNPFLICFFKVPHKAKQEGMPFKLCNSCSHDSYSMHCRSEWCSQWGINFLYSFTGVGHPGSNLLTMCKDRMAVSISRLESGFYRIRKPKPCRCSSYSLASAGSPRLIPCPPPLQFVPSGGSAQRVPPPPPPRIPCRPPPQWRCTAP